MAIRTALAAILLSTTAGAVTAHATPRAQISKSALDQTSADADVPDYKAARPVIAKHAMVVTAQHLATDVGVKILREGGNAVDAAVAVGYALAVVHPCCGNIGGGGFMVIHLADGQNLFLDFREKAPLKATATLFQDDKGNVVKGRSTGTYLGVGVPGTVMGLNSALAKYGTMSLSQVMQPAIELAAKGYLLESGDVKILNSRTRDFANEPNVASIFLNHGKPWGIGDRLVQTKLADTLRAIEKGGTQAFYKGAIAQKVVAASKANGGLLSMKDFADYTVQWDKPVTCDYRGYTVVSDPPPSSGGTTICEILQVLKAYPLSKYGYGSVMATHYIVEAERHAFADRNTDLGDPAFVHNPVDKLISPAHADAIRAQIESDKATPSSEVKGGVSATEGTNTTHYSVVDAAGNSVGVTYTINYLFGVGKIAGDTGFFLNNEMDDFTSKPGVPNTFGLVQGKANAVGPGKRPLSSMSPTIVLDPEGKTFMVTGSPGGSTIITTTLQSILNVIDFGMNMQQSVNAPRFHHQWLPDTVVVEPGYLTPETRSKLEAMGYNFTPISALGADEAILVDRKNGVLEGANDRRRPSGLAEGY
ncbi:gamma-glutamyltranspeptidase/glutathione hydrolase [Stakelama sediminis]|uniref:Glutathione hydrolase proenzyme n=1 Tax=Stakelama sediminis TaxID=463200 RepID=A0A840YYF9_9SPHN|nr:gamma-glutamyltransferase [Stakelama sediminis]MBB5718683.1 gamma-glutamyltranspeptidase/glutathione hydrolase [Stakelama sediminis]